MIPQAKIVVKSTTTGLQREATADGHGFGQIVKSEVHLNFSFEVFNLFNRANVLDVNNIYLAPDLVGPEPRRYGDGVGGPNPGFGQPRSIADARQLQFALRLTF